MTNTNYHIAFDRMFIPLVSPGDMRAGNSR